MILSELYLPNAPVFHNTIMKNAIAILRDRTLKLAPEGRREDGSPASGRYYLSLARSPASAFLQFNSGPGAVVLVLNKARLHANNKIVAYNDPAAEEEIGDEMEDRVYSRQPYIRLREPLNNTILQIRVEGGLAYNSRYPAGYTESDFDQLQQLCSQHQIPLLVNTPSTRDATPYA